MAQGPRIANQPLGQAIGQGERPLQPGTESGDEGGWRGAARGGLLEFAPFGGQGLERSPQGGFGFGGGGELPGPSFEHREALRQRVRQVDLVIAFQ